MARMLNADAVLTTTRSAPAGRRGGQLEQVRRTGVKVMLVGDRRQE
jgi:hypothetical protein